MKTRRMIGWLWLWVMGLVGLTAAPAFGAGTNVSIVDFAFSPAAVTINPNDSVTWNWVGTFAHSSTSDNTNLWNSGILAHGATFSHTFTSTGTFPYHCAVHPFMTASVTVQGQTTTNAPPSSVTLSAPQISGSGFQFSYSATPGLNYAVDRSADMLNWSPLATNNASSSQATFVDSTASGLANFYRVRLVSGQ